MSLCRPLVSEAELKSLEISDGYPIGKWIGSSPKNHVRWQRLLALRSRSPVRSVFPTPDADGHQRIYDNRATLGSLGVHIRGRSAKRTLLRAGFAGTR